MNESVNWTIRFSPVARRLYSLIPRGEAAKFTEAVQLLRKGFPDRVIEVDDNLYEFKHNGYYISFEIVKDVEKTVRIIAFVKEQN